MKTRILVAGIGGVGGYFGGLLAKQFHNSESVDIIFFARGKHLEKIKTTGLKVITGDTEFTAQPILATDKPSEIGLVDIIIVTTKSYDLENVIYQLRPCINENTIILPLLNGIDSKEKVKSVYPDNIVLNGCSYIVSLLKEPGVINNTGNIQTIYFGLDNYTNDRLLQLEGIFRKAKIEATLSNNISTIIWEKFIFISATATATSYFDNCIGELFLDKQKVETIERLVEEVKQLAKEKGVYLPENITESTLNKLRALPYETTSSMHRDFQNKKPNTELDSLTGHVISEARRYNFRTPMYMKAYEELKTKAAYNSQQP